jgi:hypothetical protein
MRRIGPVLLTLALGVGVTGCSASKYHFVSDGTERVAFKVLRNWRVYDLPTGRSDRLSPDSPEDVQLVWSKGFDADPAPDPAHLDAVTNYGATSVSYPVGVANVYEVQGTYNQKLSLTVARTVPLGFDPLFVQDDTSDLVEIIDFQPLPASNGLQGSRVIFNERPNAQADWRTFDMITYIDQGRFRMYTFTIGCLGPCFKDNEARISDIAASWSVRT